MKKAVIHQMMPLDRNVEEAVNTICTNLVFAGPNLKKIVFTSTARSEGTTWMVMNVVDNLVQRGRKVVLVDADMRYSRLMKNYKIKVAGEELGLAHYLTERCDLQDVIYQTNLLNAYLIPVGSYVTNPISLVDTPRFANLMNALTEQFDMVIVDAPPIGVVIDAAEIAAVCDGAVLVIDYNKTRLRDVRSCKQQIEKSGTPVLGCIINRVNFSSLRAKKYCNKSNDRSSLGRGCRKGFFKKARHE